MTQTCIIKGNVIDIEKIEMIEVVRTNENSGMYYSIQFNFISGHKYKAGIFERGTALALLAKCLETTTDVVEPIILNAEYHPKITTSTTETESSFIPTETEETTTESEEETADVQDETE